MNGKIERENYLYFSNVFKMGAFRDLKLRVGY